MLSGACCYHLKGYTGRTLVLMWLGRLAAMVRVG